MCVCVCYVLDSQTFRYIFCQLCKLMHDHWNNTLILNVLNFVLLAYLSDSLLSVAQVSYQLQQWSGQYVIAAQPETFGVCHLVAADHPDMITMVIHRVIPIFQYSLLFYEKYHCCSDSSSSDGIVVVNFLDSWKTQKIVGA